MARQWTPTESRTPHSMRTHYNRGSIAARANHRPKLGQMGVALILGCAQELAEAKAPPSRAMADIFDRPTRPIPPVRAVFGF